MYQLTNIDLHTIVVVVFSIPIVVLTAETDATDARGTCPRLEAPELRLLGCLETMCFCW